MTDLTLDDLHKKIRSEGFIHLKVIAGHWQRCKVVCVCVCVFFLPCIDLLMMTGFDEPDIGLAYVVKVQQ